MSVLCLHHVSMIVKNTEKALEFYRGVLGLALDQTRPDLGYPGAWLSVGAQQIHLLELPNPDPVNGRPEHGGRDRHLALQVTDLREIEKRLARAGFVYSRSRSGRRALFCRDHDGNGIELLEGSSE